jgi:DNA gyrase subunit B/topoisomerase-4 subunit B
MSTEYSADQITILKGLEAVRKRPGMYIGGTDKAGLHHLLWEIVDNCVDEAIHGHADQITVQLSADQKRLLVKDNGRGIPVEPHPKDPQKRSALVVIFSELHAGGKFGDGAYKTSGGLHGVGSSVVNALSSHLRVQVRRNGKKYEQLFSKGNTVGELQELGDTKGHGTDVEFEADPEIFPNTTYDPEVIAERLESKAYLHPNLKIVFKNESAPSAEQTKTFEHKGGLAEYIQDQILVQRKRSVVDQIYHLKRNETWGRMELALAWTESTDVVVKSFVNGIPTGNGGTHEAGLKDALNRALRTFVDTHNLCPKGLTLLPEDFREGLMGAIHVLISEPQFQGQTKDRLNNAEVKAWVANAFKTPFEQWLNENQTIAQAIITRAVQAARARLASRSAVNEVKRKTAISRRLNLPGKLADCSSNDPSICELFLVEGDSAGGSAKQGRDRKTQAILPLRGKVLNAEQATEAKVMGNQELADIVNALGCGIGKSFDLSQLRYHKVILLMDADSDGHHISTLLLTFFYRYLRPLIEEGYVYIAQPPLYKVEGQKRIFWVSTDAEKDQLVQKLSKKGKVEIQRFKGLGEMMPNTLFETTLNPENRKLLKVEIQEMDRLHTENTITELMGKDSQARFDMVTQANLYMIDLDV